MTELLDALDRDWLADQRCEALLRLRRGEV
jgi:hypothetical protein